MAFRLHCDRCLAFITNVTAAKLKDFEAKQEVVCKTCEANEAQLNKAIEKIRQKVDMKVRQVEQEIKEELTKEMQKIVESHNAG